MTQQEYIRFLERQIFEYRHREVVRKARLKQTIIAVALTASILAFPIASMAQEHTRRTEWENTREVITVTVHAGDSVDGYWAEYAPSWMDRSDYREAIKELNDMDSCYLYAGQFLKIYVEGGK